LAHGVNDPYPHLRQYVFSRAHDAEDAPAHITVTAENPVAVVQRLKTETSGSGIWLCGGGRLASTLIDHIDRLVLKVNPIVLGSGIPLFAEHGRSHESSNWSPARRTIPAWWSPSTPTADDPRRPH
jgi:dihydrofolate reductase